MRRHAMGALFVIAVAVVATFGMTAPATALDPVQDVYDIVEPFTGRPCVGESPENSICAGEVCVGNTICTRGLVPIPQPVKDVANLTADPVCVTHCLPV